jgi:hypothetical protein
MMDALSLSMVRRIQTRTKNSNNLINEYFSKLAIIDNQLTRSLAAVAAMTRKTHTQQPNTNNTTTIPPYNPFLFFLYRPAIHVSVSLCSDGRARSG